MEPILPKIAVFHGFRKDLSLTAETLEDKPNLDELYKPPAEMIQKAVLDRLFDFHVAYIKAATFFCLATGSDRGLDASPRGGPPGFVHVLNAHTLAFADWPGNNKIASLRNLERHARVGMLFIFPGLDIFLRVNGRGKLSTDMALRQEVAGQERLPKLAVIVSVDKVFFHCGKAINRAGAGLWNEATRVDRHTLPTAGQIMGAIAKLDASQVEFLDAKYNSTVKNDLF